MRITKVLLILLISLYYQLHTTSAEEMSFKHSEMKFPGQALRNQVLFFNNDALFMFGGTVNENPRDFSPAAFADEGYRLDLSTQKISPLNPPPIPLMSVNTIVPSFANGRFGYAVGGISNDGQQMKLSDRIYRYSFADDRWTELSCRLPSPRTLFGLIEWQGKLLVFGGWEMDFTRPAGGGPPLYLTSQLVEIDPQAETVQVIGEIPQPRRSFGIAVTEDHAYLLGGLDPGFDYVVEADRYSLKNRSWDHFPTSNQTRAMCDLIAIGKELYVAGGFSFGELPDEGGLANPFEENTSIEKFDPQTQKWSIVVPKLQQVTGGSAMRTLATSDGCLIWGINQSEPGIAHLLTYPSN